MRYSGVDAVDVQTAEFLVHNEAFRIFFVLSRCEGWGVTSENLGMGSADSLPNGMGTVPVS